MDEFFSDEKVIVIGAGTASGQIVVENLGERAVAPDSGSAGLAIIADITPVHDIAGKAAACIIMPAGKHVRGAGMKVIGPGSLGIIDAHSGLCAAAVRKDVCRMPRKGG